MLRKLEEWEQKTGELPGFFKLYRHLLLIQIEASREYTASNPDVERWSLPKDVVLKRLAQGFAVFEFDDLRIDWQVVEEVLQKVLAAIAADVPEQATGLERLHGLISDAADLKSAARLWYEGASLIPVAFRFNVDSQLLAFSLQATLKPILSVCAESVLAGINQEMWRRGNCPVCGGKPDFAWLEKENGARWLVCWRCDTQWIFQRLQCPYCGNTDQRTLAYFEADEGPYRLYICEACKKYIKAIDLRRGDSDCLIPLERFLTADLDRQAEAGGYKAGWVAEGND